MHEQQTEQFSWFGDLHRLPVTAAVCDMSYLQVQDIEVFTARNSKTAYAMAQVKDRIEKVRINVGHTSSFDRQMEQAFAEFGYQPHERPSIRYRDNINLS